MVEPSWPGRFQFIRRVAARFERARVAFVFLNSSRPDDVVDSDLDVGVERRSLAAADALVRSGYFGRIVRVAQYDVPWCGTYTLEVRDGARRFRQLDIACDPWSINRLGAALSDAVSSAIHTEGDGLPRPDAATEAVFVCVKKAVDGKSSPQAISDIRDAIARAPVEAARRLSARYGRAGETLVEAVTDPSADGAQVAAALVALRRTVARERRRPGVVAGRLLYGSRRLAHRLTRPTGLVVYLAGPDGVGKSTLADRLTLPSDGLFARSLKLHAGPGLLPTPSRLVGRAAPASDAPHDRPTSGSASSLVRLAYLWIDHQVFWWVKVWPARVRSSLVIIERGWHDLAIDPVRYRLRLRPSLVRSLVRLLPRPDLVFVLDAPAGAVLDRKTELSTQEVTRQLSRWNELASDGGDRYVVVDSTQAVGDVASDAVDAIVDRLADRQYTFEHCELAMRCLGQISSVGSRYAVIGRRRRPRWLLPTDTGTRGPVSWQLYRPADRRRAAGALALELVNATRARALVRNVTLDPAAGLGPELERVLGTGGLQIAGAATGDARRGTRALISVRKGDDVVAFAKVTEDRAALEHERNVLEALAEARPKTFTVPRVIDLFPWDDAAVLVLEALPVRGRANRSLGEPELAMLAELAELGPALEGILGSGSEPGLVPVHGDFAPWNSSAVVDDGHVFIWDWEETRLGLPLEDYFHWELQRLLRFGSGNARVLVMDALSGSGRVPYICRRLGVDPATAQQSFRRYLEWSLSDTSLVARDVDVRREALVLLGAVTTDGGSYEDEPRVRR